MSFSAGDERERQLEVVVELGSGADREFVERWLNQRTLMTMRLGVGLLAQGGRRSVQAAFGAEADGGFSVPDVLRAHVTSIYEAPPKVLHGPAV